MAFSFTSLPDYAFDQTLSFTNMNILKGNQQDLHDSLDTEHIFTSGAHRRITKDANLIINPTARQGNAFWWDAGAGGAVNDPGYASPANFSDIRHWTTIGGSGPFWIFSGASGGFLGDLNERIVITAGQNVVLSGFIWAQVVVAGDAAIGVVCYDAGGNFLSVICQTTITASTGLIQVEATGVTPANTAYVRVRKWMTATWNATTLLVGRFKLEKDTTATAYSDDSIPTQYLSARYHMTAATQTATIANNTLTIVDLNIKDFDDPGVDRVSPDDGGANRWRYTADRYQKLRVSCHLEGTFTALLGAAEEVILHLYKNGGLYSVFHHIDGGVISIPIFGEFSLQGSDIIEMNKGDYLDIRLLQTSGGNYAFETTSAALNYISIEEI